MGRYTFDIEASDLLNERTVDYLASPYKLKDTFEMHCIVLEDHSKGTIHAFYNGDKYILDGRKYEESDGEYNYVLENYKPLDYVKHSLEDFPEFVRNNITSVVAHNGINYDHLVCKLYYGMDYTVVPDSWDNKDVEIIDTLVLSKTLNPDRFGGHSLDNLALSLNTGAEKIQFRKSIPQDKRFKFFAADMLYYCIVDVQVNTKVYNSLEKAKNKDSWDWSDALDLEKQVAEIVTRQEHRGFKFDGDLARSNITELDAMMEDIRGRVEPVLPKRPATKKFMKGYTPPARQLKKDETYTSYLVKFANKHNGVLDGKYLEVFGVRHTLPMPLEPLKTEMEATVNDTTHIKEWLVSMGWNPLEYKE